MSAIENPPAFPNSHDNGWNEGMTLRDWFAGRFAAAAITACAIDNVAPDPDATARDSYEFADAMLAARSEQPK